MSLERHSCISVVCDTCGDAAGDLDESCFLHFNPDDLPELREYLRETEWSVDGDKHYCPACTEVRREEATAALVTVGAGARAFLPELTETLPGMGDHA